MRESGTSIANIIDSIFNHLYLVILNNPPSNAKYIGGVGTENSISRGREHNPCAQFIILSRKLLDIPEDYAIIFCAVMGYAEYGYLAPIRKNNE